MKKVFTILLIVVACVYILLWVSPYFLKNHFNKKSENYIGRKANVEKLSFNPFRCSLEASDFTIQESSDTAVFLGFKKLYVNVNLLGSITGVFQVEEITLDSPFVNVISYGDGFNFDDLAGKDTAQVEEAPDTTRQAIAFKVSNLSVSKGDIIYYDQVRDHKIELDELSFLLPQFAYDSESANMDLSLKINETGKLTVDNEFYPEQSKANSHIRLEGLGLQIVRPYLSDILQFNELHGRVGVDVFIRSDFKNETNLNISGAAWFSGVDFTDSASVTYLAMDSLYTTVKDLDVFGQDYHISSVLLDGFYLRYDVKDSSTSLNEAFAPLYTSLESDTTKAQQDAESDSTAPVAFLIDTVIITNSHIDYYDYTLEEPFEYKITEVTAVANNISSDSSKARLSANGVLNEKGEFNANMIMPISDPLNFDVDFVVKGFQMGDISPFTLTYAGHPIFDGRLVYTGHTVVQDGLLQSENKVVVYDLEVGDKVSGNFLLSVPLKFAIFLLKDKNGVVNLDLPLSGDMNDPDFKVGPVLWQILKQNLEKAVAAPGKLLAQQSGIDPEEIKYAPFQPLDTILGDDARNTLTKLGELVNKKPGLEVQLAYYEPSNIESLSYAFRKSKTQYVSQKLKYKDGKDVERLVESTDNRDLHFVTFLNEKLSTNSTNADSLALEFVGRQEAIFATAGLAKQRENVLLQFISSNASIDASAFKIIEPEEVPKFPVETSGFVIHFAVK